MPITQQRPRKEVSPFVTTMGWPLFRWSRSRRAYVLRVVGHHHGPVLKPKPTGRFSRETNPYG
jgi:hypothetical protein